MGIALATFGLTQIGQFLSDPNDWPAGLLCSLYLLALGFLRINRVVQTLEITESEIIYQSAWQIVRVPWHEIDAYVLTDSNFIAANTRRSAVLLDLDLGAFGKVDWPVAKCAQCKTFIERKMSAVGASNESQASLHYHHGIKIKP